MKHLLLRSPLLRSTNILHILMHEAIHFSVYREAHADLKEWKSLNHSDFSYLPPVFLYFSPHPLEEVAIILIHLKTIFPAVTICTKHTVLSYANLLIEIPCQPDIPLDPTGLWKGKAILMKGGNVFCHLQKCY